MFTHPVQAKPATCEFDAYVLIDGSCPLVGQGSITSIIDSASMWVMPNDEQAQFNINRASNNTFKNQSRNRSKGIKMSILGINNSIAKLDNESKNSIENEAAEFLKKSLLGKNVKFSCYYLDEKINLLCDIDYQGNNIGLMYLKEGLSKYSTKYGKHPTKDKEYSLAEETAKKAGLGIWKPFFGMFIFNRK